MKREEAVVVLKKRQNGSAANIKSLCIHLRSQLSRHRSNAWRLYSETDEQNKFTITFIGREKNKDYLKNAIFTDASREESLGRLWNFQLKRIAYQKTSILVTEYDTESKRADGSKRGFMIPFWVGWIADISEDLKKIVKSDHTLKNNLRKIKKNNLGYEITNRHEDFKKFYDTMYLPYIHKRFDSTAHFMSREEMLSQRDNCQLMYVKREQEYLSGLLIKYEPDYPRFWSIGLKDANKQYSKDGALGALYYFMFKYLKEKGHDRVYFGGTRSFLNDGSLNFKKKWPIINSGFTKQGFHFQPVVPTPGTVKLLINCPFIYMDNATLNSAVFVDPNNEIKSKQIKKLHKSYLLNGLNKIILYVFSGREDEVKKAIPAELSDGFDVRSAEQVFAF